MSQWKKRPSSKPLSPHKPQAKSQAKLQAKSQGRSDLRADPAAPDRTLPHNGLQPGQSPAQRREVSFDFTGVEPLAAPAAFHELAGELGIEFEPGDVEKLGLYLAMLLKANEVVNLTAVKDTAEAWTRHILDSLTLLPMLAELPEGGRVIDVGSGGGLPGLPLSIVMPHLKFALLEATGKKVEFLKAAGARLGLSNVTVIADRAERLGQARGERVAQGREGGHREAYDAVVARAVGRLSVLAELTTPLAKVGGGMVLLIKGQKADEELEEAKEALQLLKVAHAATVTTPTGRVVVLERTSATPRMYPRRDGEPARAPLGVKGDKRTSQAS
jgi:16S rRNA (guanine527-N7)-methyltransferase